MDSVYKNVSKGSLVIDIRDDDDLKRIKTKALPGDMVVIPSELNHKVQHLVDKGMLEEVDCSSETKLIKRPKGSMNKIVRWTLFIILSVLFLPFFILLNMLSPLSLVAAIFKPKYGGNVFIAYDQLGNAVMGGDPDETISSRVGKAARKGNLFAKFFSWYLSTPDPNHCEKAIESDEGSDGLF